MSSLLVASLTLYTKLVNGAHFEAPTKRGKKENEKRKEDRKIR